MCILRFLLKNRCHCAGVIFPYVDNDPLRRLPYFISVRWLHLLVMQTPAPRLALSLVFSYSDGTARAE